MLVKTGQSHTVVIPTDLGKDSGDEFEADFLRILEGRPETLVLDYSQVEPVTFLHISLAARALHSCIESGSRLKLKRKAPEPVDIPDLLKLVEILGLIGSSEAPTPGSRPVDAVSVKTSFVCKFQPSVESVDRALGDFQLFISDFPVPSMTVFELRTVLYEVLTNIRLHSGMDSNESVVICAQLIDSKVVIEIIDSGLPFDPTGSNEPLNPANAARKGQKRGLGLGMIRKIVDKISYGRRNGIMNVLVLEKRWRF